MWQWKEPIQWWFMRPRMSMPGVTGPKGAHNDPRGSLSLTLSPMCAPSSMWHVCRAQPTHPTLPLPTEGEQQHQQYLRALSQNTLPQVYDHHWQRLLTSRHFALSFP